MNPQKLIIPLTGRIDSSNADETRRTIDAAMQAAPGAAPCFDAAELKYISSAGLRVLLSIIRGQSGMVDMINVSPEVYDTLDMTGFTQLMRVQKRMREVSVDGCPVVGRGYYGTVYRLDSDTMVKVYASPDSLGMIEHERSMARLAFLSGIPTPIAYDVVKVGGSYGSMFELLKARTLNDLLIEQPARAGELTHQFADVLKTVHAAHMAPGTLPSAKAAWLYMLDQDLQNQRVTQAQWDGLHALIDAMPEKCSVVHGDYHMKNVMLTADGPMLIDMDTITQGDPVFDLQGIYTSYVAYGLDEPGNSMAFFGISSDMSRRIWQSTLRLYLGTDDAAALASAAHKIRLAAAVRFLFMLEENDPLTPARVRHTQAHISELLPKVSSLALTSAEC